MRVIMLSSDRLIFVQGSPARVRMEDYSRLFDHLDVIAVLPKRAGVRSLERGALSLFPAAAPTKFGMLWSAYRLGARLLRERSGDTIITAQDPFFLGLVGFLLARRFRVRLQLQVHTDFLSPFYIRSIRTRIETLLARFLLPRASCVRVVLERTRRELIARGIVAESRIRTLPIHVNLSTFETPHAALGVAPAFPRVFMVSRLEPEKDVALGVRAFADLAKRFPDATLAIAGSGTLQQSLEALVRELCLTERVAFLGWLGEEEVAARMRASDIFLNTSRFEGYGRTLIEAAAAGLPIVTTDVGVIGDVLTGESASVAPVSDGEALSQELIGLAEDGARRVRQADVARRRVHERVIVNRAQYLDAFKHAIESCR